MRTIGEVIEAVYHLQLKGAVLSEAIEHLSKFIARDSYVPSRGLVAPVGSDVIPQEIIEEVRDELVKLQAGIVEEADKLTRVSLPGKAEGRATSTKKLSKKVGPKNKRRKVNAK